VKALVEKAKTLAGKDIKKNVDEVSKGLYLIMALIVSHPYELEEWTEELLGILIEKKKVSKYVNDKFEKQFVQKFFEQHKM